MLADFAEADVDALVDAHVEVDIDAGADSDIISDAEVNLKSDDDTVTVTDGEAQVESAASIMIVTSVNTVGVIALVRGQHIRQMKGAKSTGFVC